MAKITHNLTLSTTDFNLVGNIKVRQADDETQVFKVNGILENGVPKSFVGLTPFFCLMAREITGQGVSEEPVQVFDSSKGVLEYTLSANAMQMVGRNEAYFSFKKELSNGRWTEQFSTKSFFYTVEKSIYTQPFKDSNYWFTFKELYRKFVDYQESGIENWEKFVEQNRDILESIDPGGVLLSEVIRSRKPIESDESYADLPARLDNQIGRNSDFRSFESSLSFMKRIYNEAAERAFNIKWMGADNTGEEDSTQAKSNVEEISDKIFLPEGRYNIPKFQAVANKEYIGSKNTLVNLSHKTGESAVLLGFGSNTEINNLHFKSGEEDLEWNRGDLTGSERVNIHNCIFEGFRHTSVTPNSWGLYLEHSKDVRITNCDFFDNTQSDIAILDGCENIVIDSCFSSKGTLHINFEPNTSFDPIRNVVLKNMKINKLSLLNNSLTNDGIENLLIENCEIDVIEYRGLDVTFVNCKIHKINGVSLNGNLHAGNISFNDSLPLSQNLLTDPYFESYASVLASNAEWLTHYSTAGLSAVTTRHTDAGGKLLRIGTRDSTAQACTFKPKMISIDGSKKEYTIDVAEGDTFVLTVYGSASYTTGSVWISLMAGLLFMDSSGNTISDGNVHISMFRATEGSKSGYKTQTAVITVPPGVSKLQLKIGPSKASTLATFFVGSVSFQKVIVSGSDINLDYNPRRIGDRRIISAPAMPNSANGWGHYQPGDICYNSIPSTGQPVGWICTESGYPGVWKALNNLN